MVKRGFVTIAVMVVLGVLLVLSGCKTVDPNDTCGSLDEPAKTECYTNSSQCDKIENQNFKESCIVNQVKENGDSALCDTFQNPQNKAYCQVSALIHNDINDSHTCNAINDTYWKNNCHAQMAVKYTVPAQCGFIDFEDQRRRCYQEIAYATNDPELCRWTVDLHYQCVSKIAVALKDETICEKIFTNDAYYKARCYLKLAKIKDDVSICAKADYPKVREECQNSFLVQDETVSEGNATGA